MGSLYKLREDYAKVLMMMYDNDYDEQTVIDTLDAIEDSIEEKAESYGIVIQNLNADIEAIEAEENRLKKRRKALERHKSNLQGNLFNAMKTVGKSQIKTTLFSFYIQKNGGLRKLVLDVAPEALPVELRKVTIAADSDALRRLLGEAESCEYCHLAEQGESLRIR